jgi:flagellar hook-associated protein FlgK
LLNTATQELKELLNNNKSDCIQTFLQGLTATESTDYSLWKATKKIKLVKKPSPLRTSQGTWARSNVEKVHTFAEHLADFFSRILQKNQPLSTNSNHQSTVSKELKFKKSSAA